MTPVTPDTELTLSYGNQRAVVSPWGASLRRYYFIDEGGQENDIAWGYAGGNRKRGGQGDVLIPFPGRISNGRYAFDGATFQLECNDKEGPNAIHGFVRNLPWNIRDRQPHRITLTVVLHAEIFAERGYPFSLSVTVTYELNADGLSCAFRVENIGDRAAPVGVGFHPYFTLGTAKIDEAEVQIPGTGYLEFNERLVPTGRIYGVTDTAWDYRRVRPVAQQRFNHCYVNLERNGQGIATALLRHSTRNRTITITMNSAFSALVVYTGDAIVDAPRVALAIEPMTCASDAFNHPDWGLKRLVPGEIFSGCWGVDDSSRRGR